jgi:PAS domain S-box-containing protein
VGTVFRNFLTSDLPLVMDLEPQTGRLRDLANPDAAQGGLNDLLTLLRPDDGLRLTGALTQATALDMPHFRVPAHLVQPIGGFLPVMIHGASVKGARPGRYLCTITDETAHSDVLDRFHLATAASNEVIFLLDFDTNAHWWSEAFTRAFGHPPFNTPDAVARWFDLVHPADKKRVGVSHSTAKANAAADTWQDEYRLRRADGSYARVIDRARFFRRPDGSIARSISTLTDVTNLREVEDLFHETAEAAQDVIYSHDLGAGTMWLNEAFKARYGHDPLPFANDPHRWNDLLDPADREAFIRQCIEAIRGTTSRLELRYRLRRADGHYCAVIDIVQIIRDENGRALRLVGTIVDVTARRAEEERTHALVEVAADAIYEYDVAADTFLYSEGVEKTFGHAWTGPQPAMVLWVQLLHPDERDRVWVDFLRFLSSTDRYAKLDYRLARADGTWARVCERMIALRDAAGVAQRVIGGIEDVTLAYETEERLRQSQKLEAIGRLTGGVAHDFNNLLTVIMGSAGLLETDAALAPEHRSLSRNVTMAAQRGAELTSGLLSFARQQPLAPRPLHLPTVFAEMVSMLKRTLPAYVTLATVVTRDLWPVEADPTQLNTALLNLCVNAADAMPAGGRITMESRNWVIDADDAQTEPEGQPGEFLRIDITDSGTGMAPEVLTRAFDPFFTTKPVGKGSGLGLSMVWGFAKQSGGHAKIYSEPGLGTTVSLFLPRARAEAARPEAVPRAEPAYGHGEHILIVEDDPMLRRFVVTLTERLRYRVTQAENGDQALQMLRENPDIDLMFSDVVMPGNMSGAELAERATQEFPGLLLLFTSGYSENTITHNGRLDAGVQFLAKPYQLRELGEKLRTVFASRPVGQKGQCSAECEA